MIDPAYEASYIISVIQKLDIKLKVIYLTHCHGDHISAIEDLYNKYGNEISILIHENDKEGIFDDEKNCKYIIGEPNFTNLTLENIKAVKDGDVINIGNIALEVMHTPGHTNGSSILHVRGTNILITGDTIFSDCYGRTDLKSGSDNDMNQSLDRIFSRFKNMIAYPGHGLEESVRNIQGRILR